MTSSFDNAQAVIRDPLLTYRQMLSRHLILGQLFAERRAMGIATRKGISTALAEEWTYDMVDTSGVWGGQEFKVHEVR